MGRRLKAMSRLSVAERCLSFLRWTLLDRNQRNCTGIAGKRVVGKRVVDKRVLGNVAKIVDCKRAAAGSCRDTYSPGSRATASS